MPYVTEDNLTDVVLERWNDIPDPRLRQKMQSPIKYLHGFVREVAPRQAEGATGIEWPDSNRPNVLDQNAIYHSCYLFENLTST
jgi:hypothetical protein